jgi:colanic acid biosynthesis glycosyl transferase WcaI
MRLLLINQYFPPDATNTATLLGELAEDLTRQGHEVWVVAGRPSYTPSTGATPPVSVRLLHTPSFRWSRVRMVGRLANYGSYFVGAAVRVLRVPRPDLIVTYSDPPFLGLVGCLAAIRHRRRLVQVYYDVYPDVAIAVGKLRNPLVLKLWRFLNRLVRAKATRLVTIGRDMRERLLDDGVPSHKIVVLPNWADSNDIDAEVVRRTRQQLLWTNRFVILHAGNVGLAHNLHALVEAAERLNGVPDLLFAIMGDGAAKAGLEQHARLLGITNVQFIPYLEREMALQIIASADCHVVSLARGLSGCLVPSKIYGIMAAVIPIVAAVESSSEIARIVEETECGIRTEPHAADIARGVLELRKANLQLLGSNGRAAFDRLYRREIVTKKWEQLFSAEAARGMLRQRGSGGDEAGS